MKKFSTLLLLFILLFPTQTVLAADENAQEMVSETVATVETSQTKEIVAEEKNDQADDAGTIKNAEDAEKTSSEEEKSKNTDEENQDEKTEDEKNKENLEEIAEPEEEPVKVPKPQVDPWKNLAGFRDLFNADLFTGAANFSIPLSFPSSIASQLSLQYNSYSKDRLSPYGYGWDLTTNGIFRQSRYGTAKMYERNDFAFKMGGKGSELREMGSSLYMSEFGNDLTKYYFEGAGWRAVDTNGNTFYFGQNASSRQSDPANSSKVFAWMLDEMVNIHGDTIKFSYFQDKGQIYPQSIEYAFNASGQNLYRIQFHYTSKNISAQSFQTQFKIETFYLLTSIDGEHFENGTWKKVKTYTLAYDSYTNTIPRLTSFTEQNGSESLPPLTFTYYDSGPAIHLLKSVSNNRGGKMTFSYAPSTAYTVDGKVANILPFIVKTLAKVAYEDTITGASYEENYEYTGGHYYIDYNDVFGREYAGFHESIKKENNRIAKTFFHQSQFSTDDGSANGEYSDHISKKGRVYRQEVYDASGKLYETRITKWTHQDLGNNRFFVFPIRETTLLYDGGSSHTDMAVTYEYDSYANVIEEKFWGIVSANSASGDFTDQSSDTRKNQYTYAMNASANLVHFPATKTIYDHAGTLAGKEEYYYDNNSTLGSVSKGNVTQSRMFDDERNAYVEANFTYDSHGNLKTATDPKGNVTTIGYDADHYMFPISETLEGKTDARDLAMSYDYDFGFGLLTDATAPNSLREHYDYDTFGRLKTKWISDNQNAGSLIQIETYTYNDTSQPNSLEMRIFPEKGNAGEFIVVRTYMDGFGREIQTRKEAEDSYAVSDKKYDADSNVVEASFPYFDSGLDYDSGDWAASKVGTQMFYDVKKRVNKVKTATGDMDYTYVGLKTTTVDQKNIQKDFYADAFGNLARVTEYNAGSVYDTAYEYDALNLLTKITDSKGNIKTFAYNSLGWRLTLTDIYNPASPPNPLRTWSFSYDDNGNLLSATDPNGQIISNEYDEFNRITKEKLDGAEKFLYAYSDSGTSKGFLVDVSGADIATKYEYDVHGNATREDRNFGGKTFVTNFESDILNRPFSVTYPDTSFVSYSYNTAGLLEAVHLASPSVTDLLVSDIDYSPLGQMTYVAYGNGATETYTYDSDEMWRLRSKVTSKDSTKFQNLTYTYDTVGNITTLTDASNTPLAKTVNYGYDDLYRLTSAVAVYGNAVKNYNQTYSYDSIGNMLTRSNVGTFSYTGTGNANPHATTSVGAYTFTYDRNGNMLTDGQRMLTYNYRNLIDQAVMNGVTTKFVYDHGGNRVLKESSDGKTWYANQFYEERAKGSTEKKYAYIFAGNFRVATIETAINYDGDGDGYTEAAGDCNDSNAGQYPGAAETCGDSVDQDCSGADLSCSDVDNDGDGYTENAGDCNDSNGTTYPGAVETCGDGVDQDCSGSDLSCNDVDNDGDSYTENGGDCNDSNAGQYPGATEVCGDSVDQDCSGSDLSCNDVDNDGDSYTENGGDCNDDQITVYPGAPETCGDGVDQDCSGTDLACSDDDDGDGYTDDDGDCDDTADDIYPGAPEICGDGIDQDCSGADEACAPDRDGDGIPDSTDNCPDTRNSNQTDSDSDGKGNICDNDQRLKYAFTPDSDALKIVDSTNYQNHGTIDSSRKPKIINMTDWAKGYAAYFDGGTDGSSDNIYLSDNSSLDYFEGLTVSAWLKPDTVTGHHSMVSKWGKDGSGWEWDFYIEDGKLSLLLNAEDSDCGVSETFAYVESKLIPANKWTHVTATYDGSKIRFYINGTAYPASSHSNMPVAELCDTSEKVRLGVSGYYDNDYIGYVDEVKISNYAKNAKEVCEQDTGYRWNIATLKCRPVDFDKDGYTVSQGDCDDLNPQKYPGKGCGAAKASGASAVKVAVRGIAPVGDADSSFLPETFSFIGAKGVAFVNEEDQQGESYVPKGILSVAVGSASSIGVMEASQSLDAAHVFDATTVNVSQTAPVDQPAPVEQYAPARSPAPVGFSTTTVALYYTFGDHLGSSSVTLDASGNLVQATDYFPYGGANVDEKYGSFANPYTYTGKELDSEVDLYYYGARYYNAGFSRFTSVDPALFDPQHLLSILADPQSLNSYAYARNNPIIYIDPDGNAILPFLSKMLGKIGGAIGVLVSFFLSYETANAPAPRMQTVSSPSNVELFATLTIGEIGGEVFGRFLGKFFSVIKGIFTAKVLTETVEEGGEQIIKRSLQIQNRALATDIVKTFQKGEYSTIILDEDITAYRVWGGTSEEISDFFGIEKPIKSQANDLFNLPSGNTQEHLTTFTISKGTEVNIGQVEGGKGIQLVIPNAKNNPGVKIINQEDFK